MTHRRCPRPGRLVAVGRVVLHVLLLSRAHRHVYVKLLAGVNAGVLRVVCGVIVGGWVVRRQQWWTSVHASATAAAIRDVHVQRLRRMIGAAFGVGAVARRRHHVGLVVEVRRKRGRPPDDALLVVVVCAGHVGYHRALVVLRLVLLKRRMRMRRWRVRMHE